MTLPADYALALQKLFPRGRGWPEAGGSNWAQLLKALAVEPSRVDARALDLLRESDPRTCEETLPDWEAMLGLPDPCFGNPQTFEERRALVVALLRIEGGQSPEYFEHLAALFGTAITVSEEFVFTAGLSSSGDGLADEWPVLECGIGEAGDFVAAAGAPFCWWVESEATSASEFVCGDSTSGDLLFDFTEPPIACLINRFKPAHTRVHHDINASRALAQFRGE